MKPRRRLFVDWDLKIEIAIKCSQIIDWILLINTLQLADRRVVRFRTPGTQGRRADLAIFIVGKVRTLDSVYVRRLPRQLGYKNEGTREEMCEMSDEWDDNTLGLGLDKSYENFTKP